MAPTLRTRAPKAPAPVPAANAPARAPLAKKKTASTRAASATKAKAADTAAATAAAKAAAKTQPAKAATGKTPTAKAAPKKATKANTAVASKPSAKASKAKTAPKKAVPAKPVAEVTLDHTAYPHIFDLIVEYAPHSSLLALRAASKALCARVDALLVEHVVLRAGLPAPKGKKWMNVVSVSGEPGLPMGPAKSRQRQHRCRAESILGRLPGFSCDFNHVSDYADEHCSPLCLKLRQRWEEKFHNTEVLDLHFSRRSRFDRQKLAFNNPDLTVRVFPPSDGDVYHAGIASPNLIIFTDFSPLRESEWERVSTTAHVFADEQITHRLVYNVAYDVRRPTLNNCWVNLPALGRSVRSAEGEVVIIFEKDERHDDEERELEDWESPDIPETQRVNPAWKGGEDQRQNGWLWDVANLLRVDSPACYTIIGATEVPYMCVGLSHDIADPQEKIDAIMQNFIDWIDEDHRSRSYQPSSLSEEREDQIRSSVAFFTHEEYRELIGEEQWKLETVPSDP
ncbi:hypothetical protein A1Q2_00461 [Trichosporon asahii var. asahii CBS 8904]|uniref:Uncharacterized protein n=1 Tax=Trichosporon asahii var. asahii (strain CBS 8904) TaxID=1220162 RepID=K1VXI3_TRIAC|nr:hypothetical protein A1Q2_00461 [Trichosporon asahii var. asahii CBS 8904]